MEEQTAVVETPPAATEPVAADPFAVDETKFASLSPEQRAAIEPVISEWKTKAKQEIEKTGKTYEEKYKPHVEKATALDKLVEDPRFIGWWNGLQQAAQQSVPGAQTQGVQPRDIATPEEWQMAMLEAQQGNGARFNMIQQRFLQAAAAPVVQQLQRGQEELKATIEMRDLFERHPDATKLDSIGRNPSDPNDQSLSLLEMALNWAAENKKSMEDGYKLAKKWADSMSVGAKQEAMGIVQSKKESVTSGPSTSQGGQAVVEVADADELMSKNMEYVLAGQKPPRFVIRPQSETTKSRWTQRT